MINDNISNRAVCFMDVLGFKNMVRKIPLPKLVAKYEMLMHLAVYHSRRTAGCENLPTLFPNHPATEPLCILHVFSDSFIFVANDSSEDSCRKLLVFVWRMMQQFLAAHIAVRGGITCKEVYISPDRGTCLGLGLTEAYELEQKQNWVGIAVDPSVEKVYPGLFQSPYATMADLLFPEYMVPLKEQQEARMRAVNWRFNLVVERGTRWLFNENNEPGAGEKIKNTLDYAKWIVQRGRTYGVDQSTYPVELRTFYVGKSEPPFDHGDSF